MLGFIYGLDPLYFLIVGPTMLLAMWAQMKVKSAFSRGSRIATRSGITGAQAAAHILEENGLQNVGVERVGGFLSDHYDPSKKVLRLSPKVYDGHSISAVGVAAHEAGHAIQDKVHYAPLALRKFVVPIASGGDIAFIVFLAGWFLQWQALLLIGIALFSGVVLFQLINLPVEFDASARARKVLQGTGIVTQQEDREVGKVLNAAAMTYVAATITSVATLLYFLLRSGLLGGSDD